MEPALFGPPEAPRRCLFRPATEVPIRALGVSLVAIAAIVASLTIVRQRHVERRSDENIRPEPSQAALDLEELRVAGL